MTFTGLVHDLQQRELDAWNSLALFVNLYGENDDLTKELRTKWIAIYYILTDNGIPRISEGRNKIVQKETAAEGVKVV